jgi:hypothetical protein
MPVVPYNREQAVAYAHTWAFGRNPRYYNFQDIGGDCTNFTSQCIYAGSGVMNYNRPLGWYYSDQNNRSPSWTSVPFLFTFIVNNQGVGPFAKRSAIDEVEPGDFLQLGDGNGHFYHSPFIVSVGSPATPDNVLVATHTYDSDNRPLSTYTFAQVRFIHLLGVRR